MATEAVTSQGSKISFSAVSPVSYVQIPGVKTISLSITVTEFEDITCLDSTGGFRERVATLKDGDKISFDMVAAILTPNATQLALQTAALAVPPTLGYFKYEPFGAGVGMRTYLFQAYVGKFILKADTGKAQVFSVELQVTGPVTPA